MLVIIGLMLANAAELVIAGLSAVVSLFFGVFFWINIENSPSLHPIWTASCGILFIGFGLFTVLLLITLKNRLNRLVDSAAREETAAQLNKQVMTVNPAFKTYHI